eukprot:1971804-Rhodomonas_salina.1
MEREEEGQRMEGEQRERVFGDDRGRDGSGGCRSGSDEGREREKERGRWGREWRLSLIHI